MRRIVQLVRRGALPPGVMLLLAGCASAEVSGPNGAASLGGAGDDGTGGGPGQAEFGTGDDASDGTAGGNATGGVSGPSMTSAGGSATMTAGDTSATMTAGDASATMTAGDASATMTGDTAGMDTSGGLGDCNDGETRACYGGPANTNGVGICMAGSEACVGGSWSGSCDGQVLPASETCDGVDQDCSGVADNGNPGGGGGCSTGLAGVCAAGTLTCQGGGLSCVANTQASQEICGDGIDQDCNGVPDDGCNTTTCPYVYAHDGERFVYESAVGGASLVGRARQLRRAHAKSVEFTPLWLRLDRARVEHGRARARLWIAEDEIAYVDRIRLAIVEHPQGTEVYSPSALQGASDCALAFDLAATSVPVHACWNERRDVTDAIAVRDDVPLPTDPVGENVYDLDFGPATDARACWLLVDGWKLKRPHGRAAEVPRRRPYVAIEQADGSWRELLELPSPRGDRKGVCIDLGTIAWPSGRRRLRLSTGTHEGGHAVWYLDRVRLCEAAPRPVQIRELAPARAELHFAGLPDDRHPLRRADGHGPLRDTQCTHGRFTRYGDVAELLAHADDRLVVMRRADAIDLEFTGIGPATPGCARTLMLGCELAYKPRVPAGRRRASSRTAGVDPLPHRGMPAYGHSPVRDDDERRAYLAQWNTREYPVGSTWWGTPPLTLRPRRTVTRTLTTLAA